MTSDSPSVRHRILLLTGMLGAGKTTALNVLEDLGWETIDNFPIRFLNRLIGDEPDLEVTGQSSMLAIGFDARTRGFVPEKLIAKVKKHGARADLDISTVFLDCSDEELVRRFNETRRRHPLAVDLPIATGLGAERELLAPLRRWADILIDTSQLSAKQLQDTIREQFSDAASQPLTVTVSSFGFARGMPPVADYVFDMRFLDNPHWHEELRPLTGRDLPVAQHIQRDPSFETNFASIHSLIMGVLPRFQAVGKPYVHIAFGCTGGRHRSVFCAETLGKELIEAGYNTTILHRNLQSRAADLVESTSGK